MQYKYQCPLYVVVISTGVDPATRILLDFIRTAAVQHVATQQWQNYSHHFWYNCLYSAFCCINKSLERVLIIIAYFCANLQVAMVGCWLIMASSTEGTYFPFYYYGSSNSAPYLNADSSADAVPVVINNYDLAGLNRPMSLFSSVPPGIRTNIFKYLKNKFIPNASICIINRLHYRRSHHYQWKDISSICKYLRWTWTVLPAMPNLDLSSTSYLPNLQGVSGVPANITWVYFINSW